MTIQISVAINILSAVKAFAATKDVRTYLNGVSISIRSGDTRLTATTGALVTVYRLTTIDHVINHDSVTIPDMDIIIPIDLLKHVKGFGHAVIIIGEGETRVKPITVLCNGVSVSGHTIDAVFPDIARVIPKTVSGEAAQFDPALIKVLDTASKSLHPKSKNAVFSIGHNGLGGALVNMGNDNMACVIMPWRIIAASTKRPEWV